MSEPSIPKNIKAFIEKYIGSIQQLEVLLLISMDKNRHWTVEEISKQLNFEPSSVGNRLLNLWAKGFVQVKEGPIRTYFASSLGAELRLAIEGLEKAYRENRGAVLELIYTQSKSSLIDFSDAFRFREENEDA